MSDETCGRKTCPNVVWRHGHCKKHAKALGLSKPLVDAGPITRIVREALDNGWSLNSLAVASGRSTNTIFNIRDGKHDHLRYPVAQSIITALNVAEPLVVPTWRAMRRVQSLRAAGFKIMDLADGMGLSPVQISNLSGTNQPPASVGVGTFRKVDKFWRAHSGDPVREPDWQTKLHRWTLPMQWWDIDDPDERRDPLTPAQKGDIVPKSFALRDAARFLMDSMTDRALEVELGTSRVTAYNIVQKPDTGITREIAHRVLHLAGRLGWEPGQNTEKDVA